MTNETETGKLLRNANSGTLIDVGVDLQMGMGVLFDRLNTLCDAIINSDSDMELMPEFSPVLWIAQRLSDNIDLVNSKITAAA
jgi:hypothetical protein